MTRPDASYSNFVKSESMSRALLALVLLAAVASAQQKNAFKGSSDVSGLRRSHDFLQFNAGSKLDPQAQLGQH
jgi:hypothetical protein